MKTSIVIPIYNLEGDRLRNFNFVLARCLDSNADEIIIVEQVNSHTTLELPEDERINHIVVQTELSVVHKTLLCNIGAEKAQGEYLFFNDADIYIRIDDVISRIGEDDDVIKPFKYFAKFTDKITDEFINKKKVKTKDCSLIYDLGAGAIVIRTELFKLIRGFDERYMGWGFEDKEIGTRLERLFDIKVLDDLRGVHLYHDTNTKFDLLDRNSALYRLAKKTMWVNMDKYIRGIRSELPYIKKVKSRKTKDTRKIEFLHKILNIPDKIEKVSVSTENFVSDLSDNDTIRKIAHVTAPALLESKPDLLKREKFTLESMIMAEVPDDLEVYQLCVTDSEYEIPFTTEKTLRNSTELGDKKGLPYLKDLYDQAASVGADVLVYTNSDCVIHPDFYKEIANMKGYILEFHRMDVFGDIRNIEDYFENPHRVHETGVDGIAIKTEFWAKYRNKINFDFFIGEPHWDTSVCGIFRRLGISSINTTHLYHPKHDLAWDTSNLTPAGKHNTELYNEYRDSGLLEDDILSIPQIDTSVVIVHYGHDELRLQAIRQNLDALSSQDLEVEYVFVEMVFDETAFPEFAKDPRINHIQIPAGDNHKNIWQKEAMMNIGAKEAIGEYIIFIDSDVHSPKTDWFRRIRNKIKNDPRKMVQGFRVCRDSQYPVEHSFISCASEIIFQYQCDLMHNPGLVWGISKNMLQINDYINPYMIYGGGDSVFMHEYLGGNNDNKLERQPWIFTFPNINNIKRTLDTPAIMDCVDDDVVHCNHGKVGKRNYKTRHYMTGYFTKPMSELVKLDKNGLLVWEDPDCPERKMCMKRYEMDHIHTVKEICLNILKEK